MNSTLPVGRARDVATFDALLRSDAERWVWLIDGLTGVGKSFLVEWLRRHRRGDTTCTLVSLGPRAGLDTILARVTDQIGGRVRQRYGAAMDTIRTEERRQVLVHNAPVMMVDASGESAIGTARQSAGVTLDGAALAAMTMRDRRQQRIDAFIDAFDEPPARLVLVFDDADSLDDDVCDALLAGIVPRLRDRVPELRIVIAGQTVPADRFDPGHVVSSRIDVLDEASARELLTARGVLDPVRVEQLLATSGGLPWLLVRGAELEPTRGSHPSAGAAPAERTRWIFDRVVNQLRDPGARTIAADIALLDWFDLGILRALFGDTVGAGSLDELVRRSFVKPLPDGGYVCHGVIRPHLREQRWSEDSARCRQLSLDAHRALRARLLEAERAHGAIDVPGRLGLAAAALSAASAADREQARSWSRLELAVNLAWMNLDYTFEWIRLLEASTDPQLREIAADGRRCSSAIAIQRLDPTEAAILVTLASECSAATRVVEDVQLTGSAATAFRLNGRADRAVQVARDGFARHPDPLLAIHWSAAVAATGDLDGAGQVLSDAIARLGATDSLRLAEGQLAQRRGDIATARARYLELAEHAGPAQRAARICLARLVADSDVDRALAEVDAVLRADPGDLEALDLKLRLLGQLGRHEDVAALIVRNPALAVSTSSHLAQLNRMFQDVAARRQLIAELELQPERITRAIAATIADVLAAYGEIDSLERLATLVAARWPDLSPVLTVARAQALLALSRPGDAAGLVAPLLSAGPMFPGVYLVLAQALHASGRTAEVRPVLERLARDCPAWAGEAWAQILSASLNSEGPASAIAIAGGLSREISDAPQVRFVHAMARLAAGDVAMAERLLDAFVLTERSETVNVVLLVSARALRGLALHRLGRTEEARQEARDLISDFGDDEQAQTAAAQLLIGIGDERGLRDLVVTTRNDRVAVLLGDSVIEMVLKRQSDPEALVLELEREPDRFELVNTIAVAALRQGIDMRSLAERTMRLLSPPARERYHRLQEVVNALANPLQITSLREMMKTRPDDPAVRIALVNALRESGQFSEALAELHTAAAIVPAAAMGPMEALLLLDLERLDDVEAKLRPYLDLELPPNEYAGPVVRYLRSRGDLDRALSLALRFAEKNPDEREGLLIAAADLMIESRKPEEALRLVEGLTVDGVDQQANLATTRAIAMLALDRASEVESLMQSVKALPGLSRQWSSRVVRVEGDALRALGRLDEALVRYGESADLSPRSIKARLALADLLEDRGDREGAAQRIVEVMALDTKRRPELQARLERLRGPAQVASTSSVSRDGTKK